MEMGGLSWIGCSHNDPHTNHQEEGGVTLPTVSCVQSLDSAEGTVGLCAGGNVVRCIIGGRENGVYS